MTILFIRSLYFSTSYYKFQIKEKIAQCIQLFKQILILLGKRFFIPNQTLILVQFLNFTHQIFLWTPNAFILPFNGYALFLDDFHHIFLFFELTHQITPWFWEKINQYMAILFYFSWLNCSSRTIGKNNILTPIKKTQKWHCPKNSE